MIYSILVVEKDEEVKKHIKEILLSNGYNVTTASDCVASLNIIKKSVPDLVVLDLNPPDINNEDVYSQIRSEYPELGPIVLTKPLIADNLLAMIKNHLSLKGSEDKQLKIGDLILDTETFVVRRGNLTISLTRQELKLLQYMMQNKGRILTRDMILNRLWLSSVDIKTRIVDVYVGYLRKKVDQGFDKKFIHSVRGHGYMMKD